MILAIFHAGGQTRDKKMETICKENTNTISFLRFMDLWQCVPLSLVICSTVFSLCTSLFSLLYSLKFSLVFCISNQVLI